MQWVNMHLLGDLELAPAQKNLYILRLFLKPFSDTKLYHSSVLHVCLLHVHVKLAITCTTANNLSLALAFYVTFYPGTSEFYVGHRPSYALA